MGQVDDVVVVREVEGEGEGVGAVLVVVVVLVAVVPGGGDTIGHINKNGVFFVCVCLVKRAISTDLKTAEIWRKK